MENPEGRQHLESKAKGFHQPQGESVASGGYESDKSEGASSLSEGERDVSAKSVDSDGAVHTEKDNMVPLSSKSLQPSLEVVHGQTSGGMHDEAVRITIEKQWAQTTEEGLPKAA